MKGIEAHRAVQQQVEDCIGDEERSIGDTGTCACKDDGAEGCSADWVGKVMATLWHIDIVARQLISYSSIGMVYVEAPCIMRLHLGPQPLDASASMWPSQVNDLSRLAK